MSGYRADSPLCMAEKPSPYFLVEIFLIKTGGKYKWPSITVRQLCTALVNNGYIHTVLYIPLLLIEPEFRNISASFEKTKTKMTIIQCRRG
jgi:hypothetical protein